MGNIKMTRPLYGAGHQPLRWQMNRQRVTCLTQERSASLGHTVKGVTTHLTKLAVYGPNVTKAFDATVISGRDHGFGCF